MIIKNEILKLDINPVGACIDDFTAYGIKIADKGITIGRYTNRIKDAKFTLNGKEYILEANEGKNVLHSGPKSYSKRPWDIALTEEDRAFFSIFSKDMDQGFPGNLKLSVEFKLEGSALVISYEAESDADTVVNFTNHMYINLNGGGKITNHTLYLNAAQTLEADAGLIPTGKLLPVEGKTDYTKEKQFEGGLDTSFILRQEDGFKTAAILKGLESGLVMKCETTEPCLQVYNTETEICLESQHYPDSPNHPEFPSTVLKAGTKFTSKTVYTIEKAD